MTWVGFWECKQTLLNYELHVYFIYKKPVEINLVLKNDRLSGKVICYIVKINNSEQENKKLLVLGHKLGFL